MIKNFILTIVLASHVYLGFFAHEYYVSLTEVTYDPEKQNVEIISRLFHDDFENVLRARYDEKIIFRPSEQTQDIDKYIKLYFKKKFILSIDGKNEDIEYLGFKFDQDRVNVFLKITSVNSFNSVSIENLLLTDLTEEQKNIVHCFKLKQKKSVLLTRYDAKANLEFD
jgi:hypothetical protein